MSNLESGIEIELECKMCQDHTIEIQKLKEKTNKLAKFKKSSRSLKNL